MLTTLLHQLDKIRDHRASYVMRVSRHTTKLGDLPAGLFDYWATTAAQEFAGIPHDALFFTRAAEALMDFFDCVARSIKPCALPSKAADSVWHAWLCFSPSTLEAFCLKHYRRPIPHVEASDMPGTMDEALASCLVAARRLGRLRPAGPNLPSLFTTDRRLGMPHGFAYRVASGRVGVARMDGQGRAGALAFPASLLPTSLVACGLVQASEVPDTRSGGFCGTGSAGSAAGGCDAGDGGGGGCGSGCGAAS